MSQEFTHQRENMIDSAPVLSAHELTLRRPPGAAGRLVLDAVSLTLDAGETVLLHGPSGAGKSTLLWVLARLLPCDGGELALLGRTAASWRPQRWRERVALVLQKHSLLPGTVHDNLLFPWTLKVRIQTSENPEEAADPSKEDFLRCEMDALALEDVALGDDATRLSVGQSSRVCLLRTLLTRPACLLLDEPCAALDAESAARVRARIAAFAAGGGAVLVIDHGEAAVGDRRLRLAAGKLSDQQGDGSAAQQAAEPARALARSDETLGGDAPPPPPEETA